MNVLKIDTSKEFLHLSTPIADYTISVDDMLTWRDSNKANTGRLHRINSAIAMIRNELFIDGKGIRQFDGQVILDSLRRLRDCGYYSIPAEL